MSNPAATNIVELTKVCTNCNQHKPYSMFAPDKRRHDGKTARCRVCLNEYHRNWNKQNPDAVAEHRKNSSALRSKKAKIRAQFLGLKQPESRRVDGGLRCCKCKQVFPEDHYRSSFDKKKNAIKKSAYCFDCSKQILNFWRKSNKDRQASQGKRANLKRLYGLSVDALAILYQSQGGRCAICRDIIEMNGQGKGAVDHCHATGAIRGLLCSLCNSGLGFFQDSEKVLMSAIDYLKKSRGAE